MCQWVFLDWSHVELIHWLPNDQLWNFCIFGPMVPFGTYGLLDFSRQKIWKEVTVTKNFHFSFSKRNFHLSFNILHFHWKNQKMSSIGFEISERSARLRQQILEDREKVRRFSEQLDENLKMTQKKHKDVQLKGEGKELGFKNNKIEYNSFLFISRNFERIRTTRSSISFGSWKSETGIGARVTSPEKLRERKRTAVEKETNLSWEDEIFARITGQEFRTDAQKSTAYNKLQISLFFFFQASEVPIFFQSRIFRKRKISKENRNATVQRHILLWRSFGLESLLPGK